MDEGKEFERIKQNDLNVPDTSTSSALKNPNVFSLKINKQLVTFLVTFGLLLSIFYALTIQFESYVPIFNMQMTSATLVQVLQFFGLKATLSANEVDLQNFVLAVVRQCTGLFEVITLLACVLAFPTNWKNKLMGIGMGLPLIYAANIVRLVFLAYLGVYYFPVFEVVHDYILQLTFFSSVIFIWFAWIDKVVRVRKNADAAQQIEIDRQ
jgi:archaeosortase B (VPXXXP-CTERM-specific)